MPVNRIIAATESVRFDCSADGSPTPVVKWLINGISLDGDYLHTYNLHDLMKHLNVDELGWRAAILGTCASKTHI
jgi:hypothetical protein